MRAGCTAAPYAVSERAPRTMTVRPSIGLRPLYLALQDAPGTYTSTLRMASRIYSSLPARRELEALLPSRSSFALRSGRRANIAATLPTVSHRMGDVWTLGAQRPGCPWNHDTALALDISLCAR
jgi:hypothetical protein